MVLGYDAIKYWGVITMFAMLQAIEDGHGIILCFASKEDADRFRQFTNIYMDDSGAGNGYGAYWVYNHKEIIRCDKIPSFCATRLERKLVSLMVSGILIARMATKHHSHRMNISIGERNGAITFNLDNLPARKRPTAGDMFRTVKSIGNEDERLIGEGRVLRDLGDTLEVISCWDEDDRGKPRKDAKVVTVRTDAVMKINDWKLEHRMQYFED
ncbi:MAG: hypothetical protein HYT62_05085 [Candidatus Yanofskybacteria bacterium]|nr:hypothetical protein [Candidatus Yanofskybacteria bacterium]